MKQGLFVSGLGALVLMSATRAGADQRFQATLTGAQQVPPVASTATGTGTVLLNTAETQMIVNLSFSGLTGAPNGAHIHGAAAVGANAGVLFDFSSFVPAAASGSMPPQTFDLNATQVSQLKAGQFYFNIHTAANGGGEIRGQIMVAPAQKFTATLTGAQQVPPVTTSATGSGTVLLNATEDQITVDMSFSGLTGAPAAAHIHGPGAAGTNAGVLFDLSGAVPAATSGSMSTQSFAISRTQVTELKAGLYYFNIHTAANGGGEIRGQILLAPTRRFSATLAGWQQAPPNTTTGTGTGTALLSAAEDQISVDLSFSGLTGAPNAAHIHGPADVGANAGVLFDFSGVVPAATSGSIPTQTFAISAAQVTQLKAGQFYFNIHTAAFGGGEIRGQILLAPQRRFVTSLTGAAQVPAVVSPGTGSGTVFLNSTEDQITVNASFASLTSNTNASHIHGPAPAGVNAGVLFSLDGLQIGTTGIVADQTYAITAAQVSDLKAGQHYINVHTVNNAGGEIRGQLGAVPLLTVTQGGTGTSGGTVTSSLAGIACGGDCTEAYDSGTAVTLTAGAPTAGSFFAGWTGGGCSGRGSCVVSLAADTTVTAVYTLSSTAITFTNDPLTAGQTLVTALDITELRNAINTLRANTPPLGQFSFTDSPLAAGATIRAVHLAELRTALDAVYTQRGRALPNYADATITATQTAIRGLHVSELRLAVRLIE